LIYGIASRFLTKVIEKIIKEKKIVVRKRERGKLWKGVSERKETVMKSSAKKCETM